MIEHGGKVSLFLAQGSVQHEIPLLELVEKRLSMDIHLKMAKSNFSFVH